MTSCVTYSRPLLAAVYDTFRLPAADTFLVANGANEGTTATSFIAAWPSALIPAGQAAGFLALWAQTTLEPTFITDDYINQFYPPPRPGVRLVDHQGNVGHYWAAMYALPNIYRNSALNMTFPGSSAIATQDWANAMFARL